MSTPTATPIPTTPAPSLNPTSQDYKPTQNIPLFYAQRYTHACTLQRSGHTSEALNIAFSILEQKDVPVYRRAVIHLFISKFGDSNEIRVEELLLECLELLERLRESGRGGEGGEWEEDEEEGIRVVERQAEERLSEIYEMCLDDEDVALEGKGDENEEAVVGETVGVQSGEVDNNVKAKKRKPRKRKAKTKATKDSPKICEHIFSVFGDHALTDG